jgi:FK506-binding nuclear protein
MDGEDDDDDERDLYGLGEDDYDESPDEDELEDLSELESEDDSLDDLANPRVTEVDSEEEAPKLVKADKKGKNKRPAEDEGEAMTLDELITKTKAEAPAANGEKPSKKQAKKLKNNEGQAVAAAEPAKEAKKVDIPSSDKKKVQFAKNLEQGPTGSPKVVEAKKETAKGPRNVGGVTVEDKKEGKGKNAKKGDKIEMRYIGKLKNGKQFDGEWHAPV